MDVHGLFHECCNSVSLGADIIIADIHCDNRFICVYSVAYPVDKKVKIHGTA